MSLVQHAERELRKAGLFDKDADYGGMLGDGVLELVKVFAEQGHSGMSAGLAIHLFATVANYRTLTPIDNPTATGEYIVCDLGETTWQGTRKSTLFSMDNGRSWYDLDGKLNVAQRVAKWLRLPIPRRWLRAYVTFPLAG